MSLQKYPKKVVLRVKFEYISISLEGSKVYKLLNLQNNKIEIYRDTEFNEYRFPFVVYK